jgi:hypothetical protein
MSNANGLCPCADLDWRDVDQTAQHHPECNADEVQTVTIDTPPVGGLIDVGSRYWRFGESGAVPFDGSIDSVEVSNRALTQDELLEMAHKKMAEVDFANDKLVAYEPVILPMGLNDSLAVDKADVFWQVMATGDPLTSDWSEFETRSPGGGCTRVCKVHKVYFQGHIDDAPKRCPVCAGDEQ